MTQSNIPQIPDIWTVENELGEVTTFVTDINTDLNLRDAPLNDLFCDHPQLVTRYGALVAECEKFVAIVKQEMERIEGHLDMLVRQEMIQGDVKVTETKVKHSIKTRQEYVVIRDKLNVAERQLKLAKAAWDSIIHRRDMLIGLGANYRAENSTLSLNKY